MQYNKQLIKRQFQELDAFHYQPGEGPFRHTFAASWPDRSGKRISTEFTLHTHERLSHSALTIWSKLCARSLAESKDLGVTVEVSVSYEPKDLTLCETLYYRVHQLSELLHIKDL